MRASLESCTYPFLARILLIFTFIQFIVGTFARIGDDLFGQDIFCVPGVLSVSPSIPVPP